MQKGTPSPLFLDIFDANWNKWRPYTTKQKIKCLGLCYILYHKDNNENLGCKKIILLDVAWRSYFCQSLAYIILTIKTKVL